VNVDALAPPAARQGPGPIAQPLLESLDVAVNRMVARLQPGDRRATGVGLGTELAQLRPYEVGDDVRHVDPAASARTGQIHVRQHVPERTLTTWILLDLSPSMAFGTALRLKADVAEGVALTFARLGVRRAGSVGLVSFGAAAPRILAPRGAKPGVVAVTRLLAQGVAPDGQHDSQALADGARRLARLARQPGLVVVVSDFRDQEGWERSVGSLALRHAVLAVEISDPREGELPDVGSLALIDPESGARAHVDTSRREIRERFAALERKRREGVARELRRLRIGHVRLSTGDEWLRELGRQLQ
jgi:uncharacterized protein (DUF58 family)